VEAADCYVWDLNPIIFKLGSLQIRYYGLLFASAFYLGYRTLLWQFGRPGMDLDLARRYFLYIFFGAVLGSFFGHRIFYRWDVFVDNPLSVFDIRGGMKGLASHGATVGILTGMFIFSRLTRIRFLELGDRVIFGVAIGATLVRVGNFFNSEIVGRQSDVAWAVCFPRFDRGAMIPRHPSQVYETILGLSVLALLFIVDRLAGKDERPMGLLFGTFMTTYFAGRFGVEYFKAYQALPTSYPLTMGQWLSIPFFLLGVAVVIWSLKTRRPGHIPPSEPGAPARPGKSRGSRKRSKKKR